MAVYTVKIDRHGTDLGFSVKGGSEHGIGIIVSDVDARGIARKPSLQAIRTNWLIFEILHVRALSRAKECSIAGMPEQTPTHKEQLLITPKICNLNFHALEKIIRQTKHETLSFRSLV